MGYIVIAMPRREDAIRLKQIVLRTGLWDEIMTCSGGQEVVRAIKEKEVSLVISTRKLRDMGYQELSTYLPYNMNILLLVKDASIIPFSSNIIPMELPLRQEALIAQLRQLLPLGGSERKKRPKRSAEEQQAIDAAKELLMKEKDMSEPDAFRYIQKNSMDTGKSMYETAQMILLLHG